MFIQSLCIFVLVCLLGVSNAAQCNNPLSKKNGKIVFNPLNGKMRASSLSTEYDAKGLDPFFNLANSFMNTVQSKKVSVEFKGFKIDELSDEANRDKVIEYETPIFVAVGFGLLFTLLMPIVGLCFCCCRCCGKCGGKRYQSHKAAEKHSRCIIMTVVLFIATVMMLIGCMFMFVTNTRSHETAESLGSTYNDTIDSAIDIAKSVKDVFNELSNEFAPCFMDVLKRELGESAIKIYFGIPLREFVRANVTGVLQTASSMAKTVDNLKTNLDDIKARTEALKSDGSSLQTSLNAIKTDLDAAKTSCAAAPQCDEITKTKDKVTMDIDFNNLPDIQSSINEIDNVQTLNISKGVQDATELVDNIPQEVVDKSDSSIKDVIKEIDNVQPELDKVVKDVTESIDKSFINEEDTYKSYEEYVDPKGEYFKYENYRYWAYIGLSALMAFIVFLLFAGLCLGICGYRRDTLPSQRNKKSTCGGNFLMAGVGFMFIFSFFLMIFCVLWFFVGIHLHILCRDIKDASLFDSIISEQVNLTLEKGKPPVSVYNTLKGCRSNKPLFQSLGGEGVYNISDKVDIRNKINIDAVLNGINFNLGDLTIVKPDMKKALEDLEKTNVDSINFTSFFTTLEKSITTYNLTELAANVTNLATQIQPLSADSANKLRDVATKLKNIDSNTIPSIRSKSDALKPEVTKLQNMVPNLKKEAGDLLSGLLSSENFLQQKTIPKILQLIVDFTAVMITDVLQGTTFIIEQATTNLLQCEPLSHLYDGLLSTLLCDNIVENMNGFWLALGWCLLFFIPAIICSVRLSKYYRSMKYDSGLDQTFENPPYNDKIPLQTYGTVEQRNDDRTDRVLTERNGDHGMLMADNLEYDHHAPPPYQQHQNQGYNNQ